MRPLVIAAELSAPPSSPVSFRDLTLYISTFYKTTIVVECGQEEKDSYYKWLKTNYLWDFIDEIVTYQENISGFRLNPHPLDRETYVIDRISPENLPTLLRNLHSYL